jgi:hypothetical protein
MLRCQSENDILFCKRKRREFTVFATAEWNSQSPVDKAISNRHPVENIEAQTGLMMSMMYTPFSVAPAQAGAAVPDGDDANEQ